MIIINYKVIQLKHNNLQGEYNYSYSDTGCTLEWSAEHLRLCAFILIRLILSQHFRFHSERASNAGHPRATQTRHARSETASQRVLPGPKVSCTLCLVVGRDPVLQILCPCPILVSGAVTAEIPAAEEREEEEEEEYDPAHCYSNYYRQGEWKI